MDKRSKPCSSLVDRGNGEMHLEQGVQNAHMGVMVRFLIRCIYLSYVLFIRKLYTQQTQTTLYPKAQTSTCRYSHLRIWIIKLITTELVQFHP